MNLEEMTNAELVAEFIRLGGEAPKSGKFRDLQTGIKKVRELAAAKQALVDEVLTKDGFEVDLKLRDLHPITGVPIEKIVEDPIIPPITEATVTDIIMPKSLYKEYIAGLKDAGEVNFTLNFDGPSHIPVAITVKNSPYFEVIDGVLHYVGPVSKDVWRKLTWQRRDREIAELRKNWKSIRRARRAHRRALRAC